MTKIKNLPYFFVTLVTFCITSCAPSSDAVGQTPNITPTTNDVDCWLTKSDESIKLQKQTSVLGFNTNYNVYQNIDVNDNQIFQTVDGFGFTLTGGSAEVIQQLNATKKQQLLQELFGNTDSSISISYLRISIGASDLNSTVFSYDDMPSGQTDLNLANFNLAPDNQLIQLIKAILLINPNIKIIAAPWSPPVWMKDNGSSVGGSLQPQYYSAYAQYFVKYVQKMQLEGIKIDAITPQNEPLNPNNNPSLLMSAIQQADFIKNNLGPAFQAAAINTKIVAYDHNCDVPQYPTTILSDSSAGSFVDGSAFHLYAGDISTLGNMHTAFPNKNVYFTEQYTASTGGFEGDLKWHLKNVVIGSMRNWSKIALEWNLANDGSFNPHTPGGCSTCKGAVTINSSDSFDRNVGYYIIAHASKFVPAGSIRIASTQSGNLNNVAFKTPSGKIVLIVENDGNASEVFNIKYNGSWATTSLNGGSVATYIF